MKPELKPGDRVRLRGFDFCGFEVEGRKGLVELIGSFVHVIVDGKSGGKDGAVRVHRSQCVKLKAKKPLRTWWMNVYQGHPGCTYRSKEEAEQVGGPHCVECIQVVEVRENRK